MKDVDIFSINRPQSQQKSENKINFKTNNSKEEVSFEKRLKSSKEKLEKKNKETIDSKIFFSVFTFLKNADQTLENCSLLSKTGVMLTKNIDNKINSKYENLLNYEEDDIFSNQTSSIGKLSSNGDEIEKFKQRVFGDFTIHYNNSYAVPIDLSAFTFNLQSRIVEKILNIEEIVEKIVENVYLIKANGKSELLLNLKPQWLGQLKIHVSKEDGIINISFIASPKTKELLDSQIDELKNILLSQNITVGNLNVSINEHNKEKYSQESEINSIFHYFKNDPNFIFNPLSNLLVETDKIYMSFLNKNLLVYSKV